MNKVKRIFEKSCSIAVIMYLSYPFLIKTGKEIELLYGELIGFLWTMVEGNEVIIAAGVCLLGIFLILWILIDREKETIDKTVEEET